MSKAYACTECDLLIELPEHLGHRHKLICPRCGHQITTGHIRAKQYILALAVTALIVLAMACSFSFISFSANGQERKIGLLQAFVELYAQGFYFVATLVSAFILLMPVLYLLFIILVIVSDALGLSSKHKALLVRVIVNTQPWAMAEVFLVGVLVALIKVISLADVQLLMAFWAYIVFAPLFTYITTLADNHRLWSWVAYDDH